MLKITNGETVIVKGENPKPFKTVNFYVSVHLSNLVWGCNPSCEHF